MILSDSESSGQEKLSSTRKILINKAQQQKFKNNLKSTGKYTILTFLPKFLFEQFRKYANIFFLTIGLLQQIPGISPAGRYVTIVPFLVILAITAIKEAVEDFKRHLEDRKINDSRVKKFHNGDWIETKWKNICVGDILMVMNDMVFPADLVMLASSEAGAVCYVETANLDGETNLKIRSANVTSKHIKDAQGLTGFCGEIEAEGPNQNLYDFTGNITNNWRETNSIGPSELLLRGSKLRNTKWIYGIAVYTGAESKLMMNSTNGPLKQSTLEKVMNYQIIFLFLILVIISLISAGVNKIQFKNGEDHTYLTTEENSGNNFFLNFLTFFILYNNLIPISLLVSLEMVRVFQAVFSDVDSYAVDKTSSQNKEMSPMTHLRSLIKEEIAEDYEFSEKCQSLKRDEKKSKAEVSRRNKKGKQERSDFFRDGIRCLFGLNSTQISGIKDPLRLAWSFYGWSYMVLNRNLRQLNKRPTDNYAVTPICRILGSSEKRVDDNKQILGAAADDKRVERNIAKLIEHKHRTANDIEKNPGPPMVNISYMKLFFTFDSTQQKNYTNGLMRRIRHLYADTMKNKIPMKLYNEENLDIIQNIFGLCIKGNFDSDIMALIDFLTSHWYEKVREIEHAGEAVAASDELKKECVVTGQDQAVTASPMENIQLSSGGETPHRNRSSYEVVKKEAHWECPWCKKAFRRRNGCNKHMQVRHPYGGNHEAQYVTPVPNSTNSTVASGFMVVDQSEVFNIDESLSMPAITGTAGEWQTFLTPEFQLANPVLLYQEPPSQSQQESQPQVAPLLEDRLGTEGT